MSITDEQKKNSLIEYINNHQEQRLWQAIRNWSGYAYIFKKDSLDDEGEDTFYL